MLDHTSTSSQHSLPDHVPAVDPTTEGSDTPPTLECLVGRFPRLVGMLMARGVSREDAEDAAQEATLVAWRWLSCGRAAGLRRRRAWLRKVAVHKAGLAERQRRPTAPLPDHVVSRGTPDVAMWGVLAALPPSQREVFEFCYLADHTYAEAGRQFGLTDGALRRRLQSARECVYVQLGCDRKGRDC